MSSPPLLVVMGVTGSGKTVVGRAVAERLRVAFADGDDLHPPANVAKMRGGEPLTDADRAPWLAAVGRWLAEHGDVGGVTACSALKRAYRDLLLRAAPGAVIAFLDVPRDELTRRLARRTGHFMPASLLESQLATLEPLAPDEPGVTVAAGAAGQPQTVEATAQAVVEALRRLR